MMTSRHTVWLTIFLLTLLVACSGAPAAQPVATPTSPVSPTSVVTATASSPFPQGITNEPLTVIATTPADKTEDTPVARDQTRIVVQFNHPVVPLVGVQDQQSLPQPLTIQPSVEGKGQWINTSTYAFTPSQDLQVATLYTATVRQLKDMLGESLSSFAWSFNTTAPAIFKLELATCPRQFIAGGCGIPCLRPQSSASGGSMW